MQPAYGNQQQGYPYFQQQYASNTYAPGPSNGAPAGYAPSPYYVGHQPTPYAPYNTLPAAIPPPAPSTVGGATPRMPRPKHLSGSGSGSGYSYRPYKSAMKRVNTTSGGAITGSTHVAHPITRARTNSISKQGNGIPLGRQRSNSIPNNTDPAFFPYHIFVTFRGTDEMVLENIAHPEALNEIKQEIFPVWAAGVASNESEGATWMVKFNSNPWTCTGPDTLMAWDMVRRLFALLAKRGYSYQSSVDTGRPPLRLVFAVAPPDVEANFFLAHFSSSGHRVTIINPPQVISENIGINLRAALPRKIASDRVSEDNVHVIEVKRTGFGSLELSKSLFMSHILKEFHNMGYVLHATVPMGKRGFMGTKGRKELWLFRSMPQ